MPLFNRIPLFRFFNIAASNGGLSAKNLLHAAPWLLKTTLFEPMRWIESAKYNKRITEYRIEKAPVFILGYYRSGTTYLQRMFMQDPSFGYTSIFQTVLPELMLTCEKRMTPLLDKASRLFKMKNPFHRIPMQWSEFPGEEDVALTSWLKPGASQWGMLFPQRSAEYLEKFVLMSKTSPQAVEEWKNDYLFLLKKISIANHGKRLILKNPPNTARIKLLLSLFPDARFVYIGRDPFDVFASTRRFWEVVKKNYVLGSTRSVDTDQLIIDSYARIMQQYLEQKALIPSNRLIEVGYEEFIQQPVETMKEIYRSLELGEFEQCKTNMSGFAAQQKKYLLLQHSLDDNIKDRILQKWAPYIQYWENSRANFLNHGATKTQSL